MNLPNKRTETSQYLEGIGNIILRKNPGQKTIRLRIDTDANIIVSMPLLVSKKRALRFVQSKQAWILKNLQRIEAATKTKRFAPGMCYKTKYHSIYNRKTAGQPFHIHIEEERSVLYFPESLDIESHEVQEKIRHTINETWRYEAKKYLPPRIEALANTHGFSYTPGRITSARTRWGSCSQETL